MGGLFSSKKPVSSVSPEESEEIIQAIEKAKREMREKEGFGKLTPNIYLILLVVVVLCALYYYSNMQA